MNLVIKEALGTYLQTVLQDSVFDMEISPDYTNRDISGHFVAEQAMDIHMDLEPSFSELLLSHIDASDESENIVFSKIRSNPDYSPSKSTAIALGLALQLDESKLEHLLEAAGYALSYSNKADLIIRYLVARDIYKIRDINEYLVAYQQKPLGGVIL